MQASQLRLLYKQVYGNVAVLFLMSFTKLYQTDQFVASYFTDLLYILQRMNIVRLSSFVRWKKLFCSLYENSLSLFTVAMRRNLLQEFTTSQTTAA
jgi:hypothetical protein